MSVYGLDGTQLNSIYEAEGDEMTAAYNKDGTLVFGTAPGTPLKVMEYNVGGWYDGTGTNVPAAKVNDYYDLQFDTIKNADPDILLINEYWDAFSDTGYSAVSFLEQFFPYVYNVPSGKYYGRAFCSKYPMANYKNHLYADESSRYYDTVVVNIGGQNVTLVVTHLGLSVEERQTQAEELLAFLQTITTPFIMAGDLNTAKSATTSGEDYINVIKPLIDAGFKVANLGDFGRFITYKNTEVGNGSLDNIVFSPDFTIKNVYVDTRKETDELSEQIDHMPLIVNAALAEPAENLMLNNFVTLDGIQNTVSGHSSSTTTWEDISGNTLNAVKTSAASAIQWGDNCAVFDGTNRSLYISKNFFTGITQASVEIVLDIVGNGSKQVGSYYAGYLLNNKNSSGTGLYIYTYNQSGVSSYLTNTSIGFSASGGNPVYVCWVFDGETAKRYINGALAGEKSITFADLQQSTMRIGYNYENSTYEAFPDAKVYRIGISTGAFSAEDVAERYQYYKQRFSL